MGFAELSRMSRGLVITIAVKNNSGTESSNRLDLDVRRVPAHDNHGINAQLPRGQRHTLGVIARRGGDHTFGPRGGVKLFDSVISAAQFEAVDGLLVFALQQHLAAEAP